MTEYYVEKYYNEYALKKEDAIIAVIDTGTSAIKVCDLLNELLPYKLLVRKHKQDLEAIYGKSIKKQLEEVDVE